MEWPDWRAGNLAAWEDRVPIHVGPGGYDIEGLLREPERITQTVRNDAPALGSLAGLKVAHLQCHLGTDTLARTGAWAAGATFTLADVVLGLSTHRWLMTPMPRPPLASVEAYYGRLNERPAFRLHARPETP
jgi:glutathione S-transferase